MFHEIVRETKAYYCLECGICTGSCPVSRYRPEFSPRLFVERAILEGGEEILADREVWSCLTCGTCSSRCPSTVDYNEFTRRTRETARGIGFEGVDTHAGTLLALMELEAGDLPDRDLGWISEDAKVAAKGALLFYTGCLPYFDVVFEDIGVDATGIANSAIRLMNACGRRPAVSPAERCCGHDLYWTGHLDTFRSLARKNLKMIEDTGARTVVCACPECAAVMKLIYPKYFGPLAFEVLHVTEFLAPYVEKEKISFREHRARVTYQDPCRLGRFLGVYEAPRRLLEAVPGLELAEMPRARAEAVCCGSSGWVSCTRINKSIQLERLGEASATGAGTLMTGCPKCNIHLSCALKDGDLGDDMGIKFVTTLLSDLVET